MKIITRPSNPKVPTFKAGCTVAFRSGGKDYSGTFVRRFSPAPNAGFHYEIEVDGVNERIFANGPVGRTVTKQEA